jgi:hypothetical protein
MDFQLITCEDYSQFTCKKCVDNIDNCLSTKRYLIQNQETLNLHISIKSEKTNQNSEDDEVPVKVEAINIPEAQERHTVKKKSLRKPKKDHNKSSKKEIEESDEKISCPECRKFVHPRNLQKHIDNVHLKLKNYECDVCSKQFYHKFGLTGHLRVGFPKSFLQSRYL